MRNRLKLLLLAVCLCVGAQAQVTETDTGSRAGQTLTLSDRNVPDTAWQRLSTDKDIVRYKDLVEVEAEPEKQDSNQEEPAFLKVLAAIFRFFSGTTGKALLWIFVACVVLYIIYRLTAGQGRFSFRKEKKFSEGTNDGAVEDVEGTDWDSRLNQAISAGDIRAAVRYSYMHTLQLLQERDLIRYRIDKTNHDYYYELADTPFRQPFRQLSRQYEYAWYGNYPLTPQAWEEYLQTFRTLKSNLKAS